MLKIGLTSYSGYGAWFITRLLAEGHKVDYNLINPRYSNILKGIVPSPKVYNGSAEARNNINFSKYDCSVFDLTGRQRLAEHSHTQCPTIGDGAFNCAVEEDRNFGVQAMEECGIQVPPYEKFTEVSTAKAYIKKGGKRYVYKPDGGQDQDTDTTYVSSSAEDMLQYLDKVFSKTKGAPFILQEFIRGTEVSVEGWFNGDEFYLVNVTLEEKKFMNDNHGPNTGCAGNLIFLLSEGSQLFKQGLGKMKKYLRQIGYAGMIDLNTIATEQGLYGLEWTPRFGYDASATLINMYAGNFGELLARITTGQVPEQSWLAEFGAAVRISIPPYPTEILGKHPQGVPIKGIEEDDVLHTFLYDVEYNRRTDEMITAGHSGFIGAPLGKGNTIDEAFDEVQSRLDRIKIPNMQMRTDIQKTTKKRYYELDRMGWLR